MWYFWGANLNLRKKNPRKNFTWGREKGAHGSTNFYVEEAEPGVQHAHILHWNGRLTLASIIDLCFKISGNFEGWQMQPSTVDIQINISIRGLRMILLKVINNNPTSIFFFIRITILVVTDCQPSFMFMPSFLSYLSRVFALVLCRHGDQQLLVFMGISISPKPLTCKYHFILFAYIHKYIQTYRFYSG